MCRLYVHGNKNIFSAFSKISVITLYCVGINGKFSEYFKDYPFKEVVYVTTGNPAFCLALYLTGIHCRGELQHVGDTGE